MMDIQQYFLFVSVAFLYIISPGPAVFLSLNYGATHGIKKTMTLLLGNSTGLAILAGISALGIGLIIVSSATLLNVVKWAGSLVLFYLGIKMLLTALTAFRHRHKPVQVKTTKVAKVPRSYASMYREGVLLSLTNPKALIFFSAIFPQFLNSNANEFMSMALLGATFAMLSFVCMSSYCLFGKSILARLLNAKGLAILNLLSGVVFVSMAGLLALSDLRGKVGTT